MPHATAMPVKYGAQLVGAHGLQYFVEKIKHSQDYFFGLSTIRVLNRYIYQSFYYPCRSTFHNLTIGYDKSVGYTYNRGRMRAPTRIVGHNCIVVPSLFELSRNIFITSTVLLSSAPVGSSARIILRVIVNKSRAIATRCFCPPEARSANDEPIHATPCDSKLLSMAIAVRLRRDTPW